MAARLRKDGHTSHTAAVQSDLSPKKKKKKKKNQLRHKLTSSRTHRGGYPSHSLENQGGRASSCHRIGAAACPYDETLASNYQ